MYTCVKGEMGGKRRGGEREKREERGRGRRGERGGRDEEREKLHVHVCVHRAITRDTLGIAINDYCKHTCLFHLWCR